MQNLDPDNFYSHAKNLYKKFNFKKLENADVSMPLIKGNFEILFVCGGEGKITVSGEEFHACEGFLAHMTPEDDYQIKGISTNNLQCYILSFNERYISSDFNVNLKSLPRHVYISPVSDIFTSVNTAFKLVEIELQSEKKKYYSLAMKSLINYLIVSALYGFMRFSKYGYRSKYPEIIEEIVNYINANYMYDIKLKDLAEMFYVNEDYLSNHFCSCVGVRYCDYVRNLRMLYAQKLLTYSDEPITNVAQMCGYGTYSNFTRTFKAHFNKTPTEMREKK